VEILFVVVIACLGVEKCRLKARSERTAVEKGCWGNACAPLGEYFGIFREVVVLMPLRSTTSNPSLLILFRTASGLFLNLTTIASGACNSGTIMRATVIWKKINKQTKRNPMQMRRISHGVPRLRYNYHGAPCGGGGGGGGFCFSSLLILIEKIMHPTPSPSENVPMPRKAAKSCVGE
jgi:hypothetical protein